ncbi:MAG: 30S ribosomal protein S4e [Candidatus Diapherotrites archaeon CG10_big_fil_rev_8_21_14_0_10_31_34]|nr:MAG: 30S ribosomal protein S4e [Candidatus Diapherotrites archaeon CG10_big_fil_rev_8_21_14_0_10_31_34]PJA20735.1 MAG: 30S ribosomal protein S4e [Candidatus Diapherotrites archaeon CG_4_10_14_0_2_um_filter_31_5]
MAKKGSKKKQKRLSTNKVRKMDRKENTFTIKLKSGPHNFTQSIPLGFLIRDILKIATNKKEVKKILNAGKVKVDGKIRKELKFPIGLFDLISIEDIKENYRIVLDSKGRLKTINTEEKKPVKLCKITGKKVNGKKEIQLNTNDGRTFIEKETELKIGDSIKISLPDQKILEKIPEKKGNFVYITGGSHTGTQAQIEEILQGTINRVKTVKLKTKEKEFKTTETNVFVIGEKKSEIEL